MKGFSLKTYLFPVLVYILLVVLLMIYFTFRGLLFTGGGELPIFNYFWQSFEYSGFIILAFILLTRSFSPLGNLVIRWQEIIIKLETISLPASVVFNLTYYIPIGYLIAGLIRLIPIARLQSTAFTYAVVHALIFFGLAFVFIRTIPYFDRYILNKYPNLAPRLKSFETFAILSISFITIVIQHFQSWIVWFNFIFGMPVQNSPLIPLTILTALAILLSLIVFLPKLTNNSTTQIQNNIPMPVSPTPPPPPAPTPTPPSPPPANPVQPPSSAQPQ